MRATSFSYHRAVAPMMWVFLALASIELIVVHILIAAWSGRVALALSVVTLLSVLWLVWAILSFRHLPVTIADGTLTMRVGTLKAVRIPLAAIAEVTTRVEGIALKDRATLNLALIAYPNVVVTLVSPLSLRRRSITAVAHRLDDPAAFVAAFERLGTLP